MGAVYIKDDVAADLARAVAALLGVTTASAVHGALLHRGDALRAERHRGFCDPLNDEDDG